MPLYAVVDVETTGGSYQKARLTDVAIYIFDGKEIIDEFTTLVNPEQPIPYMITKLTGITDEMVGDAPKFYQIARKIVEITEGCVFVGHNASFDYNFIRHEFKNLGYNFKRQTLCTVKMSRKILPGHLSYSLGNICNSIGIEITNRHRAAGDARATTLLLKKLLEIDSGQIMNQVQQIPEIVKDIPEETGVYYLHDDCGNIIYVGKSNNIYERILQHFRNSDSSKAIEMKNRISSVSYEITGSELVALLLESDEIKKHKPPYNRAQRRISYAYSIFTYTNADGYICFQAGASLNGHTSIASFPSHKNAERFLYNLVDKYSLCQKLTGLYETSSACFHYSIKQCKGACIGLESPETYNKRALSALNETSFIDPDFFIVDKGRTSDEYSVISIEGGRYTGFGYIDACSVDIESLAGCIKTYEDNRDTRYIIKSYIRKNRGLKIIKLKKSSYYEF